MQGILNRYMALVFLQFAAIWPVIKWYMMRILDRSDEPYGLLALATVIVFLFYDRNDAKPKLSSFYTPASILLVYGLTFHFLPPLLRAVIATTSLACTISIYRSGKPFHAGILGLLLLSLPLISSIQFFIGYPLRAIVGDASALLLQMSGFAVVREGTMLNWCGHLVSIDAPCSGVKMLWAGLYLALTLVCFFELNLLKSALVVFMAIFVIMISNILRTTSLFFIEAKILSLPLWSHTMLGLTMFGFASIAIVSITLTIGKKSCAPSFSS